jgi:ABC-type nitrate/sulfonate/bicarbonate transport system substrate-binding protein
VTRRPGRRSAPLLACVCAATVLVGCGERRETLVLPATPTHVVIALDDPADPPLAPLYAALAGDDFTRAGLAVQVLTPTRSALASLGSRAADFAVTSEPDLLRARDAGAQVVAIGALVQSPLAAIVSIPPHPITKVTQLDRRTVAAPDTPLANAELDTILQHAGVAPTSVRRRPSPDPVGSLARARAPDAALGAWNTDAVRLRLAHHPPTTIKIEDAGVPTYNRFVLVVRQDEARNRGPILRSFLQALSTGVRTTLATPAVASEALAAANPGTSPRLALGALRATLPALDPAPTPSPYGFVDPRVWQTFGRWMLAHGLLTRPDDAARAITDEFLPGEGE